MSAGHLLLSWSVPHCQHLSCGRSSLAFAALRASPYRLVALSEASVRLAAPRQSPRRSRKRAHHRARHSCSARCEAQPASAEPGDEVENLVIIGSGPAGYTAAIYAARANMRPLVFEGYQTGGSRGGQLMTTNEVENFPGFPEGITGPDLMDRMRAQAERWGAHLRTEDVEYVDFGTRPFTVRSSDHEAKAHSIIVATGATAKRLWIPSEEQFWNAGISACAICDGANHAFKGQDLAVVGGGDTAAEEAIFLTKYGKLVHLLVRGDHMRASNAMKDRVEAHKKVNIIYNTTVEDAYGDGRGLTGLHLVNKESGEKRKLAVKGLFYGIGHQPNSSIFQQQLKLDDAGYLIVKDGVQTSVPGIFAAGDIHDHEWRQAITAAGSGCQAALSAERWLSEQGLLREFHQPGAQVQERGEEAPPQEEDAGPDTEIDITQARHRGQYALRKLYHESDRVMVVMYTQPSCGPCRSLKPVLNKVVDEFPGKVHFVEINIEKDREIAEAGGVGGTPTVQLFKLKERLHHLPGVKNKSEYRDLIQSNL